MAGGLKPDEFERYCTFKNFPNTLYASEIQLAKAGFVSTGNDDEVMCKSCNLTYKNWNADDNPMEVHIRLSPACPFISKKSDVSQHRLHGNERTQINQSDSHPPQSFGHGSVNSLSQNRGNGPGNMNQFIHEDDIYSAPDLSVQHHQINSIRQGSRSHNNYDSLRQQADTRTYQKSRISHQHDEIRDPHFNNSSVSPVSNTSVNHHSNDLSGNNFNSTIIPPTSNTIVTHQRNVFGDQHFNYTPPVSNVLNPQRNYFGTNTTVSRTSPVSPNSVTNQRPTLLEDIPPTQRNPYNLSDVTNALPQSTTRNHSSQPHLVQSNDEAMEFVDDLEQQSQQGQDWYTRRSGFETSQHVLDYTQYSVRLSSYSGVWSSDSPVQPVELAEAGLYYTGPNDRVQCAWCRGGLYGWEPNDTAFGEHSRHFPQCPFVKQKLRAMLGGQHFTPPGNPVNTEDTLRTNLPRRQHQTPQQQPQNPQQTFSQENSQIHQLLQNQNLIQPQQQNLIQQPIQGRPTPQVNVQSPNSQNAQLTLVILESMGYERELITRAIRNLPRGKIL